MGFRLLLGGSGQLGQSLLRLVVSAGRSHLLGWLDA